MKILEINKFFYNKGGSEAYYFDVISLLKEKGNEVMTFSMNHEKNEPSKYQKYFSHPVYFEHNHGFMDAFHKFFHVLFSSDAATKLEKLIKEQGRPDVAHVHNFSYQLSPSIIYVLKKHDIPMVWTMHDYKVIAPNYNLYADGHIDESTKPDRYFQVLANRSIKGSFLQSFLAALEQYVHVKITKLYRAFDFYVAPSKFLAKKTVEYGLSEDKVKQVYNFIPLDEYEPSYEPGENYLYVGRFIREKGLMELLEAFKSMPDKQLNIIGAGDLQYEMEEYIHKHQLQNVHILGKIYPPEMFDYLKDAKALVMPSVWYENNPIIMLQAMALGKPIIGSDMGGIPELIEEGVTGLVYHAQDTADLVRAVQEYEDMDMIAMGKASRNKVEAIAGRDAHYDQLTSIFEEAIKQHNKQS